MSLSVRDATVDDIPLIQHIASLTWPETFADVMSAQQLGYMQWMMYRSEVLARQMEKEGHHFFIAENGKPLGFAGTSPFQYNGQQIAYWKLHKLYVLPYLQRTGAGKALMDRVATLARENGATTLLLNVNRQNKAVSYYEKQGFTVLETGNFEIGGGFYMNDYVMAKAI